MWFMLSTCFLSGRLGFWGKGHLRDSLQQGPPVCLAGTTCMCCDAVLLEERSKSCVTSRGGPCKLSLVLWARLQVTFPAAGFAVYLVLR